MEQEVFKHTHIELEAGEEKEKEKPERNIMRG